MVHLSAGSASGPASMFACSIASRRRWRSRDALLITSVLSAITTPLSSTRSSTSASRASSVERVRAVMVSCVEQRADGTEIDIEIVDLELRLQAPDCRFHIHEAAAQTFDLVGPERAGLDPPHRLFFHHLPQQLDEHEHELHHALLDLSRLQHDAWPFSPYHRQSPAGAGCEAPSPPS